MQYSANMTLAVGCALVCCVLVLFVVAGMSSFLTPTNPYQQLLAPLTRRLAATVGLTIMAAPAQLLTNEGWLYDLAALGVALYYWWTFIDAYLLGSSATPMRPQGPVIDGTAATAFQTASDTGPTY